MYCLVLFVDGSILGGTCAGTEACIGIFGNVLVCLLGALVGGTLDGLGDVVCGVLSGKHESAIVGRLQWMKIVCANLGGFHCDERISDCTQSRLI